MSKNLLIDIQNRIKFYRLKNNPKDKSRINYLRDYRDNIISNIK